MQNFRVKVKLDGDVEVGKHIEDANKSYTLFNTSDGFNDEGFEVSVQQLSRSELIDSVTITGRVNNRQERIVTINFHDGRSSIDLVSRL